MSNINKGARSKIGLRFNTTNYYDFYLGNYDLSGVCGVGGSYDNCLVSHFDFGKHMTYVLDENNEIILNSPIISNISYGENTTNVFNSNFGLTAYDNQTIFTNLYKGIDDEQINSLRTNLYLNTKLIINAKDDDFNGVENKLEISYENKDKLILYPVNGNDNKYNYIINIIDDPTIIGDEKKVASFEGGFYQGFYKLDGYDYQTLPNRYKEGYTISLWLKHIGGFNENTINYEFVDNDNNDETNDGYFLYFGTRAENKFWKQFEPCLDDDDEIINDFPTTQSEEDVEIDNKDGSTYGLYNKLDDTREVDNKFLLTGRARKSKDDKVARLGSLTYRDFKDGEHDKIIVKNEEKPYEYPKNPFLLYGRAYKDKEDPFKDGTLRIYDVHKLEEEANKDEYLDNLIKKQLDDVVDNAIGFRITRDGSIGYRYFTYDCEGNVIIKQKYSNPDIIRNGEWTSLSLRWVPNTYILDDTKCGIETTPPRDGQLMVYVNCHLKHVFYDFPEFIAKRLDDTSDKQLGVPYNISIGGGSIGLSEHFTLNGYDCGDLGLNIEKYFKGSFMGSIADLKIYDCDMSWCHIKSNCEKEGYKYDIKRDGYLLQEGYDDLFILLEDYGKIIIEK